MCGVPVRAARINAAILLPRSLHSRSAQTHVFALRTLPWPFIYSVRVYLRIANVSDGKKKNNASLFPSKSAVEDVQAQNLICILDVDIQGVRRIKETDLNPIYISIQPPSLEILVLKKIISNLSTYTDPVSHSALLKPFSYAFKNCVT